MPAIKAIIHEATPARCAAADGAPAVAAIVVGVIVGAGVAKRRKKDIQVTISHVTQSWFLL